MSKKPLVSIKTITYNHVFYIRQCIESILMQKTNFTFEYLISDDCSTDGTREIVKEYARKFPEIIKDISPENNFGAIANGMRIREACKGKYQAGCEGDDYWTDPLKLQKQVDFLEANPDYSLCFHDAIVLWNDKSQAPEYFCPKDLKSVLTLPDIIENWFIPSASMVFRKDLITPLPDWFTEVHSADWALQLTLAGKGKIRYLNEIMSVYRKGSGLSGGIGKDTEYVSGKKIMLLDRINKYTDYKYSTQIEKRKIELENDIKRYLLKKNHLFIYYITNPRIFIRLILRKVLSLI